jgi:hypothetical protein
MEFDLDQVMPLAVGPLPTIKVRGAVHTLREPKVADMTIMHTLDVTKLTEAELCSTLAERFAGEPPAVLKEFPVELDADRRVRLVREVAVLLNAMILAYEELDPKKIGRRARAHLEQAIFAPTGTT